MFTKQAEEFKTSVDRIPKLLHWLVLFGTAAVVVYYIKRSIRWPLMVDSPIMHYVVFLMQQGFKPYQQIPDMNMPGTYVTEWLAIRLFGPSDIAFRFYEFFLLGTLTAAMCYIAGNRRWIAAIYAAGVFIAFHASEGPRLAGERDEVIAVLLMLSYAALFASLRNQVPALMLIVGLATGLAASIKPTFLTVPLFFSAFALWRLNRQKIRPVPYLLWGLSGIAFIGFIVLAFLHHYGVIRDWLYLMRTIVPVYHDTSSTTLFISLRLVPKYILVILPFAIATAVGNYREGSRWSWERWVLAGGVVLGVISYFVQGKGLVYHRYPYLICLLLLVGMEIFDSLARGGKLRWLGAAAVVVTMSFVVPIYIWAFSRVAGNSDFTLSLQRDLEALGGASGLQDKVQCVDWTTGCLNALYHLRIVENTQFLGDMLLFDKQQNGATRFARELYWQRVAADPSAVIVLSNQSNEGLGFNRINNWSDFKAYLLTNYTEVVSRTFRREGLTDPDVELPVENAPAYRIYIRKSSPLLTLAPNLKH